MSDAIPDPIPPGNLFAHVLEELLRRAGYTVDMLDDIPEMPKTPTIEEYERVMKQRVHREIVRRLKRSLEAENCFTTLSPVDIAKVVKNCGLKVADDRRLRAAVLATAVQEQLYRRISPDFAREAAWRILPVMLDALQDDEALDEGVRAFARAARGVIMLPAETEFERRLGDAIEAIELAGLDLSISRSARDAAERAASARRAHERYTFALQRLDGADAALQAEDAWDAWHAEATAGLAEATRRL